MISIPVRRDVSEFSEIVALEGVRYVLIWRWNERTQHWWLRITDVQGTEVAAFRKIVADRPLHQRETFLPGYLLVFDTLGLGADPGLRDLSQRHQVYYVPVA